jgi:ribonuclease-3
LGKGEIQTGGRDKQNLLADCFEAVLGAAFISNGMDAASEIVTTFILPMLSNPDEVLDSADPKTTLLELLQSVNKSQPVYEITHEGPDHDRTFFATLSVDGKVLATADGRSRKLAETNAAIKALATFK